MPRRVLATLLATLVVALSALALARRDAAVGAAGATLAVLLAHAVHASCRSRRRARVERARTALEAQLSRRHGVPIQRLAPYRWLVDGVEHHALLRGDVLLIGRRLPASRR